jgi:flavin-dependent dehydrogenase
VTKLVVEAAGVLVDDRYRAGVVVGADGDRSVVRERLLGARREPRALAIRGYAPVTPELAGRQVIRYGDRRQPSYAWAFDRGDGLVNVGYGELLPGTQKGEAPSRRLLLDQLERLVPGAAATGDRWRGHHLPLSGWRWHQPDGPLLLAGDAAGLVNPMTGEGIYYAVATGILAGRNAAAAVRGDSPRRAGAAHRDAVRRLLGTHLKHTWTASRLARSPRVVDAGIRAAARDRTTFDTLVELGLGDGRISPRLAHQLASQSIGGLLTSLTTPRSQPT